MGARRAAAQRHPFDPFVVRCHVEPADLDSVAYSPENEAQARSSSARIPSADRSRGSGNSDSDGPPGWISQWSEWARLDVFRSSWARNFLTALVEAAAGLATTETRAALAKKQAGESPREEKEHENENQTRVGACNAVLRTADGGGGQGCVSQGKGGGVYPRETGRHFAASCDPAEEGKRKENFFGLRIHGAGGG